METHLQGYCCVSGQNQDNILMVQQFLYISDVKVQNLHICIIHGTFELLRIFVIHAVYVDDSFDLIFFVLKVIVFQVASAIMCYFSSSSPAR